MKSHEAKYAVVGLTAILFFFNVAFAQTAPREITLITGETIEEDFDLIKMEDNRRLGKITLGFNHYIDGKKEMLSLQIRLNARDNYLFLFDRRLTRAEFRSLNLERDLKKNKLLENPELFDTFFNLTQHENALIRNTPFETGATWFRVSPASGAIFFEVNRSSDNPSETIDIVFNSYHGTESVINGQLKPITFKIILPNFDKLCREKLAIYTFNLNDYPSFSKIQTRFNSTPPTNQTVEQFTREINEAKLKISEIKQLHERLRNEPLRTICENLNQQFAEIGEYLKANEAGKYDDLLRTIQQNNIKFACEQAAKDFGQQIDGIRKHLNFDQLQNGFNSAIRSKEKQAMERTLLSSNQHIQQLQKLKSIRASIQESKMECDEFANLLTIINPLLETESQVLNFKSNLEEQLSSLLSCEDFMNDRERVFSETLIRLNEKKFEEKIDSLKRQLDQINVLTEATPIDETKINEKIARLNNGLSRTGDDIAGIARELDRQKTTVLNRKECPAGDLVNRIENIAKTLDEQQKHINSLRGKIGGIFANVSAIGDSIMQDINFGLKNDLNNILSRYSQVQNSLNEFIINFQTASNSGKFYPRKRNIFSKQMVNLEKELTSIKSTFDKKLQEADSASIHAIGQQLIRNEDTDKIRSEIIAANESLSIDVERMKTRVNTFPTDAFPYLLIGVVFLSVSIIIFGFKVYYNALRKNKIPVKSNAKFQSFRDKPNLAQETETKTENSEISKKRVGGVTISKTEKTFTDGSTMFIPGKGLEHLKDKIGNDYYEIQLDKLWQDTTVNRVFISRECIRKTYSFYMKSLRDEGKVLETGGYLIGAWELNNVSGQYDVSLEDFIEPGDDAIYGEYQLNFGAKIGVKLENTIRNLREKADKNFVLTGWFHSHPEIKIFLSNHDLYVQEQLSATDSKPKLLALVIDPLTKDENGKIAFYTGIFSYKSNGAMNNNQGDMKLIKWKDLHNWAQNIIEPDFKNYYCINMHEIFRDSITKNLFWSNKSIINLSLFLDELNSYDKRTGSFIGQVFKQDGNHSNDIILEDFLKDEGDQNPEAIGKRVVGKFIYTSDFDSELMKFNADPSNQKYSILAFCKSDKKDLWVFTRRANFMFNLSTDVLKTADFSMIEAWPTRRR